MLEASDSDVVHLLAPDSGVVKLDSTGAETPSYQGGLTTRSTT